MTEPYMNLNFIRETMDQIFFEEYEVASFARYDRKIIYLSNETNFFSSSGNIKCISI
jgi:actin-related protein